MHDLRGAEFKSFFMLPWCDILLLPPLPGGECAPIAKAIYDTLRQCPDLRIVPSSLARLLVGPHSTVVESGQNTYFMKT